jgi:carbon starvation protein
MTFIPLLWLLAVTMTAGYQKIFDANPKIGFLAMIRKLDADFPALKDAAAHTNRVLRFNNSLDAIVAGIFLVLVAMVFILSMREWYLLIARKRAADLKETDPTWLPDYAVTEGRPAHLAGYAALAFALCKEVSGEAEIERANQPQCACTLRQEQSSKGKVYVEVTESKYKSIRRCC